MKTAAEDVVSQYFFLLFVMLFVCYFYYTIKINNQTTILYFPNGCLEKHSVKMIDFQKMLKG